MSTLEVNTINEYSAANGVTIDGLKIKDVSSGSTMSKPVLQIVNQFYVTQTSLTGDTFGDTGLTADITPTSTSSDILCMFYPTFSGEDNSYVAFKMFRDSTEIGSSTVTGTGIECFTGFPFDDDANTSHSVITLPLVYLDSPSTTSATTYKIQFSPMRSSSKTCYLNRAYNLNDDNKIRGSSNVILMEIAG